MLCPYGAPLVACIRGDVGKIGQSCCNHWDCPVCGHKRAKQEYHRIIGGAREMAKSHVLYFLTITCRGREMPLAESEKNYGLWTNRLLTRLRYDARTHLQYWSYAQVTERQKRGHPHSHILTTYLPHDAIFTGWHEGIAQYSSEYFTQANVDAGLGVQCRLSAVENDEAAARYIAKYFFKETVFERWPKSWKRVRYSQNWPKLPEIKGDAMILLTAFDWLALAKKAVRILTKDDGTRRIVERALRGNDVIIS